MGCRSEPRTLPITKCGKLCEIMGNYSDFRTVDDTAPCLSCFAQFLPPAVVASCRLPLLKKDYPQPELLRVVPADSLGRAGYIWKRLSVFILAPALAFVASCSDV